MKRKMKMSFLKFIVQSIKFPRFAFAVIFSKSSVFYEKKNATHVEHDMKRVEVLKWLPRKLLEFSISFYVLKNKFCSTFDLNFFYEFFLKDLISITNKFFHVV